MKKNSARRRNNVSDARLEAAAAATAGVAGGRVLLEAVAAVDWAPFGGLEGDLGRLSAVAAGHVVHFSRGAAGATSVAHDY